MIKRQELEETILNNAKDIYNFRIDMTKLRNQLNKLKNRKIIDYTKLSCHFCEKEYDEKDNFNWSCRIHRS